MSISYNPFVVILSVIIAILASYIALVFAGKISQAEGKAKAYWLLSGSFVMGAGVWSMHFIGMIAMQTPLPVTYDVTITLVSFVASLFASLIAFLVTMPLNISPSRVAVGGFIMGTGIIAMHYTGMAAMNLNASMSYDNTLVMISVIIAYGASVAALILFIRFRDRKRAHLYKWISAVVMGIAISGMHYTGMAAMELDMGSGHLHNPEAFTMNPFLLFGVTAMIVLIFIVSWGTMIFDRKVLSRMAYYDGVTGLPNRNAMNRYMNTDGQENLSVLFFDLDAFKTVNDTLGHHQGDRLLHHVGRILRPFTDADIRVFRIGGDEFLFTIKNRSRGETLELADKLLFKLGHPYLIDQREIYVTASIGVSLSGEGASGGLEKLREADIAMYRAKESGKNTVKVYTKEMGEARMRRMTLEKDLTKAVKEERLYMVYQPKFDSLKQIIIGAEALTRWYHPELGFIPPDEFIPIAEESDVIIAFTDWSIQAACRQTAAWSIQGLTLPVAVNVSVKAIELTNVKEMIERAIRVHKLNPALIEMEVTESVIHSEQDQILEQIKQIRELGVSVSMDDFGTGYSSISVLNKLPFDTLKLDKSFIKDIHDGKKQAIIEGIFMIASKLDLAVITEGVETRDDERIIQKLGGHLMQGYYYSKPVAAEELTELLKRKAAR
ncbi:putative bifunctional diguanylate cyclase/phosphodiesterase [Salisediminibacterium selenitireducens]|uniref:Diguanylate cyclase/phosphodiesterase with MHYT sensor n=1 Tax=Bacillus selenitireducens (strain ATCC 700615 / DSM 15326 / MLS10) TaxID=439292 RepID=D6Y0K3_BACIE|nr:bifunctional diguanylate cyclase/phosphodiesterase [Salisediminibacterium selenitireducens]ADI00571.1 diguanylate cyclase/phosphodiesterase with MHYT sensor [[Bacillus] selenitireducens MLS10]